MSNTLGQMQKNTSPYCKANTSMLSSYRSSEICIDAIRSNDDSSEFEVKSSYLIARIKAVLIDSVPKQNSLHQELLSCPWTCSIKLQHLSKSKSVPSGVIRGCSSFPRLSGLSWQKSSINCIGRKSDDQIPEFDKIAWLCSTCTKSPPHFTTLKRDEAQERFISDAFDMNWRKS